MEGNPQECVILVYAYDENYFSCDNIYKINENLMKCRENMHVPNSLCARKLPITCSSDFTTKTHMKAATSAPIPEIYFYGKNTAARSLKATLSVVRRNIATIKKSAYQKCSYPSLHVKNYSSASYQVWPTTYTLPPASLKNRHAAADKNEP